MMSVAHPVRRAYMNLHISGPYTVGYADFGVEEVGARISIEEARVEHLDGLAVDSRQGTLGQQAVLPDVMQKLLHLPTYMAGTDSERDGTKSYFTASCTSARRARYLPMISNSRLTLLPTSMAWKLVCSKV